jgi:hypothetical protein
LQGSIALMSSLDIQMLAGVETITGDVSISNSGLTNLIGLESLKTIGGNLLVDHNASLQALVGSGLINLVTVAGDIRIDYNPALTVIRLPSLVNAGSIVIRENSALTTLDGFDALVKVDGRLFVEDNVKLAKITGLQSVTSVGSLEMVGNAAKTISLAHLKVIHGALSMQAGSHEDSDALVTFTLPALTTIEGDLTVDYLGGLTTFSLPLLTAVQGGNMEFYYDTVLDDIGLPKLAKLGTAPANQQQESSAYFEINECPALTHFDHFHGLACLSTDCTAYINGNATLDNCDAKALLESFTNFSTRSYSNNLPQGAQPPDGGPATCPDGAL